MGINSFVAFLSLLYFTQATPFVTCGSACSSDANCTSYQGNPCTFCDRGVCSPMCGVGCGSSSDCAGGGNPCTYCSSRRVCINPVPGCGTFCGNYDGACRYESGVCGGFMEQCCTCHPTNMTLGCGNHTIASCGSACSKSTDCTGASGGCTTCTNNVCSQDTLCGTICSGSGQCQASSTCNQCVGYYCSQPASCGQVCISSGQCQQNPGNCKACIGTICSEYAPCGGSCGGDDWCSPSCPVCSFGAKCTTSKNHNSWISTASDDELSNWLREMSDITIQTELFKKETLFKRD